MSLVTIFNATNDVCNQCAHTQLPPVVKHCVFQKYSNFDQSMFTRLVRLGVPTVMLDKQGRARPEIAALYSWRYNALCIRVARCIFCYNIATNINLLVLCSNKCYNI